MTTRYRHTLTVLTPESDWPGMNALAYLFGESGEPDLGTFQHVRFTRNGIGYAYITTNVTDRVRDALVRPPELTEPAKSTLAGALVLFDLDPERLPAYNGQTIIAVNVDPVSAYGFEATDADL